MEITSFLQPEPPVVRIDSEIERRTLFERDVAPRVRENLAEGRRESRRSLLRAKEIGKDFNWIRDQEMHKLYGSGTPAEFFSAHFKDDLRGVPEKKSQLYDLGRLADYLPDELIKSGQGQINQQTAIAAVRPGYGSRGPALEERYLGLLFDLAQKDVCAKVKQMEVAQAAVVTMLRERPEGPPPSDEEIVARIEQALRQPPAPPAGRGKRRQQIEDMEPADALDVLEKMVDQAHDGVGRLGVVIGRARPGDPEIARRLETLQFKVKDLHGRIGSRLTEYEQAGGDRRTRERQPPWTEEEGGPVAPDFPGAGKSAATTPANPGPGKAAAATPDFPGAGKNAATTPDQPVPGKDVVTAPDFPVAGKDGQDRPAATAEDSAAPEVTAQPAEPEDWEEAIARAVIAHLTPEEPPVLQRLVVLVLAGQPPADLVRFLRAVGARMTGASLPLRKELTQWLPYVANRDLNHNWPFVWNFFLTAQLPGFREHLHELGGVRLPPPFAALVEAARQYYPLHPPPEIPEGASEGDVLLYNAAHALEIVTEHLEWIQANPGMADVKVLADAWCELIDLTQELEALDLPDPPEECPTTVP